MYDASVCESYLCAAHDLLKGYEKWLVVEAIEDSTTYGLVVFDVRFVRLLFDLTAEINAAEVLPHRLTRAEAIAAARAYFALKVDWRFAAHDGVFGHWRAGEGLDTPARTSPASDLAFAQSPWDAVLLCLGTHVTTQAELDEARAIVAQRVHDFAIQVT
ncbi:MAG: hypothetical protein R3E66_09775 [bacterium]